MAKSFNKIHREKKKLRASQAQKSSESDVGHEYIYIFISVHPRGRYHEDEAENLRRREERRREQAREEERRREKMHQGSDKTEIFKYNSYLAQAKPASDELVSSFSRACTGALEWTFPMTLILILFQHYMWGSTQAMIKSGYEWTDMTPDWCLIVPHLETFKLWGPMFLKTSAFLCVLESSFAFLARYSLEKYRMFHDAQTQQASHPRDLALDQVAHYSWLTGYYVLTMVSYLGLVTGLAGWFLLTGLVISFDWGRFHIFVASAVLLAFFSIWVLPGAERARVELEGTHSRVEEGLCKAAQAAMLCSHHFRQ